MVELLAWTLVHVIDEASPLAGLDAEGLAARHAQIMVAVSATEEPRWRRCMWGMCSMPATYCSATPSSPRSPPTPPAASVSTSASRDGGAGGPVGGLQPTDASARCCRSLPHRARRSTPGCGVEHQTNSWFGSPESEAPVMPISALRRMCRLSVRVERVADLLVQHREDGLWRPGRTRSPPVFSGSRPSFPRLRHRQGHLQPVRRLRRPAFLFHTDYGDCFRSSCGTERYHRTRPIAMICFGHHEADECGAMNEWLAVAPQAEVATDRACMVSLNDMADKQPRVLTNGETIDLGGESACATWTRRIFRMAGRPECFTRRALGTLLCGDLFTQIGNGAALTSTMWSDRQSPLRMPFGRPAFTRARVPRSVGSPNFRPGRLRLCTDHPSPATGRPHPARPC